MNEELIQLGVIGTIFALAVREFFYYLRVKKQNGDGFINGAILKELKIMNDNHLSALKDTIEQGNVHLVDAINNGNMRMIELLGEIKGSLR